MNTENAHAEAGTSPPPNETQAHAYAEQCKDELRQEQGAFYIARDRAKRKAKGKEPRQPKDSTDVAAIIRGTGAAARALEWFAYFDSIRHNMTAKELAASLPKTKAELRSITRSKAELYAFNVDRAHDHYKITGDFAPLMAECAILCDYAARTTDKAAVLRDSDRELTKTISDKTGLTFEESITDFLIDAFKLHVPSKGPRKGQRSRSIDTYDNRTRFTWWFKSNLYKRFKRLTSDYVDDRDGGEFFLPLPEDKKIKDDETDADRSEHFASRLLFRSGQQKDCRLGGPFDYSLRLQIETLLQEFTFLHPALATALLALTGTRVERQRQEEPQGAPHLTTIERYVRNHYGKPFDAASAWVQEHVDKDAEDTHALFAVKRSAAKLLSARSLDRQEISRILTEYRARLWKLLDAHGGCGAEVYRLMCSGMKTKRPPTPKGEKPKPTPWTFTPPTPKPTTPPTPKPISGRAFCVALVAGDYPMWRDEKGECPLNPRSGMLREDGQPLMVRTDVFSLDRESARDAIAEATARKRRFKDGDPKPEDFVLIARYKVSKNFGADVVLVYAFEPENPKGIDIILCDPFKHPLPEPEQEPERKLAGV